MLVCLFHGSTHMARLGASFLAFFTLSLLRPTCGRSFMSTGASRVDKDLRKNHLASAGRSEDVFIFADGRSLDDSDCPPNCLKCSTNGECLHCANSKYLNPSKWTCEDMCPDGYYPEGTGTSNRTCTQCASDCAICLSPAKCVQCQSKYLSPAGVCGSSCPSGYYAHTEGTCRSCPTRCVSCSDWHHCDTCVPGAYLTPNRTCVVDCDDGYYKDDTGASEKETGGVCTQCQETCSKCISHDVCTECRKKTYLSPTDNMCRSTCGDGFYQRGADEIGNTCHECPDSCRICTSSSACSSCSEGYFLTPDSACDTECPDGFYANSTLRSCQPCPAGCGKCTAGLVSPVVCLECIDYNLLSHRGECTRTCPEGYYPQAGNGHLGGVCVICDPSCIACQSREECTKCNMLLYLTPEAKCEMECPRGWTWRGGLDLKEPGVCMPCGDNCAACQTLEVCDVCKNRRYLHQGRCVKSCPARFYGLTAPSQGEEGRLCRNCRVNDYECFSPNAIVGKDPDPMLTVIAKSRQNDYYLYGGACHPKALCPVGTYPRRGEETPSWPGNFIGGICEDCPHNCLSCSSPLRCTTCRRNTYLTLDMSCQENCPVGFFGVGTAETGRTCQPCSANCSACQSQAFCTKCTNGTFLTADFSCEAQCPEGFYSRSPADGSLDGRACEKCLGDCLTCETRFYCTKCKNAAYLTHRKECMPACPPTHYPDGSDDREGRFCIECPGTCSECLGLQNCTECKTPGLDTILQCGVSHLHSMFL
ncbi:unnamed protein product [Durusdinium trenchii]|uniref:EGF-like domain-containing protein n=2 Tax=Durusdinium trenchii TaxID=1381693 RepID=A0ABP0NW26_9DINO